MLSNLIVKKASESDAKLIFDIDKDYGFEKYTFESILYTLSTEQYLNFLILKGDEAIGYISYSKVMEEAELIKIVIKNNYRAMGFGDFLIKKSLNKLCEMGITKVFLEVRASNMNAIKLYEKNNFKKINIRQKYYSDGEDAIIYGLSL